MRVTQKGLLVTLKRLSSKDWTHPNPLHPLLGGSRSFQFDPPTSIVPTGKSEWDLQQYCQ